MQPPHSRTPPRSARWRGDHRFQRHWRHHPVCAAVHGRPRAESRGCISACGWRAARSRLPARWPMPSSRRCGPKAGGEYVYLDAAYGRVAAFLTGWTSFVAGFAGAIAANAFFIPIYLARFIPGVDNQTPIFTIPLPYVPLTFSTHTLVALASVWLLAADSHSRRRSRTRDDERARGAQGHGVHAVRARGLCLRHRRVLERHARRAAPCRRATGCSPSSR